MYTEDNIRLSISDEAICAFDITANECSEMVGDGNDEDDIEMQITQISNKRLLSELDTHSENDSLRSTKLHIEESVDDSKHPVKVDSFPADINGVTVYEVPMLSNLKNCKGNRSWGKAITRVQGYSFIVGVVTFVRIPIIRTYPIMASIGEILLEKILCAAKFAQLPLIISHAMLDFAWRRTTVQNL